MIRKVLKLSPRVILGNMLPMFIVALYIVISFSIVTGDIIKKSIVNKTDGLIHDVKYSITNLLSYKIANLKTFAFYANVNDDYESLLDCMNLVASEFSDVASFYYLRVDNNSEKVFFINSSNEKLSPSVNPNDLVWYTAAIDNMGDVISILYQNPENNAYYISCCQAIFDESNNPKGVCGFNIYIDKLNELMQNISFSENSKIYLIDEKGRYITNEDTSLIMNARIIDSGRISSDELDAMLQYDQTIVNGQSFYAVSKVEGTPFYVIAEGPVSDFNASFKFWFRIIIIISIILIIITCVINAKIMHKIQTDEKEMGATLLAETQNLVVDAKENAATSQDQSAAVKEIVATMEDNNVLSESISTKIKDVSAVANKSSTDVSNGLDSLARNVEQLHAIFNANQQTIQGIKELGDNIENIWDIVTLINSVADQAKIIAFNAELEASAAGEAGKNFHIVATEIRRLADSIIDGTKEIKSKINEIQQSSDSLILTSESGTEKINQGYENAKKLEENFASIKNSSEITAASASDITAIIQQQAIASEQMLITLK